MDKAATVQCLNELEGKGLAMKQSGIGIALMACLFPLCVTAQELPVCQVIATGGTIASKINPATGAPEPALSGDDLIASVPGIDRVARIEVLNQARVPSTFMGPELWVELSRNVERALARPEVAGAIVSHGTDTLDETAFFLDLTVASDKPVVLTGAQRNASDFDFDGPRNLLNAARICAEPRARGKGAMLVLNSQINAAREVSKTHTSDVESFKSGDYGFLGNVDLDRVTFYRSPERRQHIPLKNGPLPRVDIVTTYGGNDGHAIAAAAANGAAGIVVAAGGIGNVNAPTYEAIKAALGQGVKVVISSRVPNGRVFPLYSSVGGGKTLKDAGALFADNLGPHKARILLMLALQHTRDNARLQASFDR